MKNGSKQKKSAVVLSVVMALLMCFMLIPVTWGGLFVHDAKAKDAPGEAEELVKYISADFYNYDQKRINSANHDAPGAGEALLFGPQGQAIYNKYVGSDHNESAVLGIAKDTMNGLKPSFNYRTVELFPNSSAEISQGGPWYNYGNVMTGYWNYGFPLKRDVDEGITYYQFDSAKDWVNIDKFNTAGNGQKLLTLGAGPSQGGQYYPFGMKNDEQKYYNGNRFYTDFNMPSSGKINDKDIIFQFSGDDDVWVYIDDKLALDIGGVHGKSTGTINFGSGLVTINHVFYDCANKRDVSDGTVYWSLYDNVKTLENHTISHFVGLQRTNFEKHTFKMFYFERGANVSNLKIRMNFNIIQKGKVTVAKQVVNKDNDTTPYTFQLQLFKNGKWENEGQPITVTNGKSAAFPAEIPVGETYRVLETTTGDFTTTYKVGQVTGDGAITEGIKSEESNMVLFTNTYVKDEQVTVHKIVENSLTNNEKYTFKLYFKENDNFVEKESKEIVGNGTVKFETKIPNKTVYKVTEIVPDGAEYTVKCGTAGKNESNEMTANGQDKEVTFTNTYEDRSLTLEKVLTGDAPVKDHEFDFVVKLFNPNGSNYNGKYQIGDGAAKNYDADKDIAVKLKGGEKVTIKGLPYGIRYSVIENYSSDIYNVDKVILINGKEKKFDTIYCMGEKEKVKVTNDVSIFNDGKITVKKLLVDDKDINKEKADTKFDNTFIFKLENITEGSKYKGMISYGTIDLKKGENGKEFTFENLPVGTYKITEMSHMRYTLRHVDKADGKVTITKEHSDGHITFKNSRTGGGYFSDTAVAVNTGKVTDGEVIYENTYNR